MKGFIYILKNRNNKFYIGSTPNLEVRMKQHIKGHTQTTRNMNLPIPVMVQEFDSLVTARRVENKLKRMKRKDFIEKIVSDGYIKMRF
ncbi:MAG: hypothetical protein A3C61_02670 [Candidatus Yanofskybacteria bacterium RIFCSPHIGHO2_02_FULL_39_10]|uniref:GIY-YIG domain-containing protein n=1 Tax=Candidatus Yanofskybacteria bacterium RIFCSPHIGHO2_02_FULL_39_10 TaxID=1802674 RepID=A0A1F8F731_9BACT|nr:MAG: hypothetical protein A3C61_02670 [Candidatus Yanofskybacteria bacterium RIFCSPHIGHO2_02_FULL_39_10]